MGAQQAVVVEQLWMKGSVESEMAKVNEPDENDVDPPRIVHDPGPPARTRKRRRSGGSALLNVAGKKKWKRNRGDAKRVPTGNKSSYLQRKLDYVLNHLRLLESNVVAESRQVRFVVVDEESGATNRQAIHTIPNSEAPVTTSSSASCQPRNRPLEVFFNADRTTTTTADAVLASRSIGISGANSRSALRRHPIISLSIQGSNDNLFCLASLMLKL
ncbi:hypothetical protein PPTG_13330 [Phytophthora nicotianae INRA-310]|uniref:Uncharacterized protein n=1 Tax=Phytophthora nicotianae (strain INRA-310) TaxID=761204 RepID=W2Q3I8_PHYN3|nr:hypothetical protein PPTG_13330 [Phytophthora nicotianae INRA-310]ETN07421.1 hypothetical protein PPTG_13330 [Phytophthora nicotianae INRA-310]